MLTGPTFAYLATEASATTAKKPTSGSTSADTQPHASLLPFDRSTSRPTTRIHPPHPLRTPPIHAQYLLPLTTTLSPLTTSTQDFAEETHVLAENINSASSTSSDHHSFLISYPLAHGRSRRLIPDSMESIGFTSQLNSEAPSRVASPGPTGSYPPTWVSGSQCDDESCTGSEPEDISPLTSPTFYTKAPSTEPTPYQRIPRQTGSFHRPHGVSYEEFCIYYRNPKNAFELRRAVHEAKVPNSPIILGILEAFIVAYPDDQTFLTLQNAFAHTESDLRFLRSRFSAYAGDMSGDEESRARILFTASARLTEGTSKLLVENAKCARAIFDGRHCGSRNLLLLAKAYGLDKIGRRIASPLPNEPDSTTKCRCCGRLGHSTSSCYQFTCYHCLSEKPGHFPQNCPIASNTLILCQFCRQRGHHALDCPDTKCGRCRQSFRQCAVWCEPRPCEWNDSGDAAHHDSREIYLAPPGERDRWSVTTEEQDWTWANEVDGKVPGWEGVPEWKPENDLKAIANWIVDTITAVEPVVPRPPSPTIIELD